MEIPEKLLPLFENPKTHNVIKGGRGGAKTRTVASLIIWVMARAPLKVICGREIQKSLKDSSFAVLSDEIKRQGQSSNFTLRESRGEIISKAGGRAVFIGLQSHTIDSIKSYEGFHWGWLEESQSISKKSLEIFIPTLRIDNHFEMEFGDVAYTFPLRMFLYTLNPFLWDDPINLVLPETRDDVQYLTINYYDNPWFPKSLEKERKNAQSTMTEDEYLRIWEGIPYVDAERAVISRNKVMAASKREVDQDGGIVVGADIARFGDDKTVFYKRKGLQVVDTRIISKMDTQTVAKHLFDFAEGGKIIIDDTGVGCITKGTKVLTPLGWVKVEDLKKGDEVYSKDINENVIIEKVRSNEKREKTAIIKSGNFEFSFSHIMPYKTRNEYEFSQTSWENILNNKSSILDADFNYNEKTNDFNIPKSSIIMPNGGEKIIAKEKTIDGKEFATFLGWYLSEGSFEKNDYGIMITQKIQENIEEIISCCKNIGKPQIKKDGIKIFNKYVHGWIKENCYNGGFGFRYKTVPRWVANNSQEVITAFLDAFMKGDGYLKNGFRYYTTSSKWIPCDFMELIYKIGKKGNAYIKNKKGSKSKIFGREITRKHDNYCIFEYKQLQRKENTIVHDNDKIVYEDNVYELCITGETKLYFTLCKDSFKPVWTHNGGVTDRLTEMGANVVPINFGGKALDKKKYPDVISEMWFNLANIIDSIGLPDDTELTTELSNRYYKYTADERRKVESKEEYKKRTGRKSPDKADAMILCFYNRQVQMSVPDYSLGDLGL